MAITPENLAEGFNSAGIDTPEKLAAMLRFAALNIELQQIDAAISALNDEQTEALRPVMEKRQALQSRKLQIQPLLTAS